MEKIYLWALAAALASSSASAADCQPVKKYTFTLPASTLLACDGQDLAKFKVPTLGRALARITLATAKQNKPGGWQAGLVVGDTSRAEAYPQQAQADSCAGEATSVSWIAAGELTQFRDEISVRASGKAACDSAPLTVTKATVEVWVEDPSPACRGTAISLLRTPSPSQSCLDDRATLAKAFSSLNVGSFDSLKTSAKIFGQANAVASNSCVKSGATLNLGLTQGASALVAPKAAPLASAPYLIEADATAGNNLSLALSSDSKNKFCLGDALLAAVNESELVAGETLTTSSLASADTGSEYAGPTGLAGGSTSKSAAASPARTTASKKTTGASITPTKRRKSGVLAMDDSHLPGAHRGLPSAFARSTSGASVAPTRAQQDLKTQTSGASSAPGSKAQAAKTNDVDIGADENITLDHDLDIGFLNIYGTLKCPKTGNITIKTEGIMIMGDKAVFECGNENQRFQGNLTILLKNGREMGSMEGARAISAMSGGTLKLFGKNKNFAWQRVSATVNAGDTTVKLTKKVAWSEGDTIILGPTGFDPHEAERRKIASVAGDGLSVTVTEGFKFKHWGETKDYASQGLKWKLDERAEVADLDRNIKIRADGDDAANDASKFGGHIMVMKTAKAYLDGVELSRMGQLGKIGRYPFHWHLAGDVPGQFIRNSSIHDTYQRCVTVHGTNQATVQNNVCFNHYGHGYFLENGNEVDNNIIGNLGMLSLRVPEGQGLLASDMGPLDDPTRFPGPSTFWISHPRNTFKGNVASGSEGTGFWNSFSNRLKCPADASCTFVENDSEANIFPHLEDTKEFNNNVAHSSLVGFTWDGAPDGAISNNALNPVDRLTTAVHYAPAHPPTFNNLQSFKNAGAGIYFRGETATFNQAVLADNEVSTFFAYNQVVKDSVIVGMSPAFTAADFPYLISRISWTTLGGSFLYDGPLDLQRVLYADFPTAQLPLYEGYDMTPVPIVNGSGANHLVNSATALSFVPEPWRRTNFLNKDQWMDSPWTSGMRDQDGSLTGHAGWVLVPKHPLNRTKDCEEFEGALVCNYDMGILAANSPDMPAPGNENYVPFIVTRSDGRQSNRQPQSVKDASCCQVKSGVILDKDYTYVYWFNLLQPNHVNLNFFSEKFDKMGPIVELKGMGSECHVDGANSVNSLDELKAATSSSYFLTEDQTFVRMKTDKDGTPTSSAHGLKGLAKEIYAHCDDHSGIFDPAVFDAAYYREFNPDLASLSDKDLKNHWRTTGIDESRIASKYFNVTEYLAMNPDLAGAFGGNNSKAVQHYISSGRAEGRFGTYWARNQAAAEAKTNP